MTNKESQKMAERGDPMADMKRANKVTAYWEGEGVAIAVFYKTHEKLATVRSTDEIVTTQGFLMPDGTEETPATATQKLEAFKTFISANAAIVGIVYDPVDRRTDEYKFPSKYDEAALAEFSKKMAESAIEKVLGSVQTNVVDKMIKAGHLPEGSALAYGFGEGVTAITENYNNGSIKYATVTYPVALAIAGADKQVDTTITVELVSGQIKKPRTIGADNAVMTMSGIKAMLIEGGVLPLIEKPKKEKSDEDTEGETADAPATETPAAE